MYRLLICWVRDLLTPRREVNGNSIRSPRPLTEPLMNRQSRLVFFDILCGSTRQCLRQTAPGDWLTGRNRVTKPLCVVTDDVLGVAKRPRAGPPYRYIDTRLKRTPSIRHAQLKSHACFLCSRFRLAAYIAAKRTEEHRQ